MLPASPKSPPPQEEEAMAMSNAERQQRWRDKQKRESRDAVSRCLVTSVTAPVTANDATSQTATSTASEVALQSPANGHQFANRDAVPLREGPSVENSPAPAATRIGPVDLEALRRDIREWTELQSTLNRAKARAKNRDKRIEVKDRILNMILLAIAVSFYGLIAYSAIMQGR